ncbi:unnamed protein product [Eruca vesicaria subsp. sativa]|uniref:Vesicle transport protein n=1 Tax=Eruca vesicaria subsp. sativa TaxID=29727 RepID=A0ABC8LQK4_ERUVS|nr:unnamed protein product [Eruca vesicaria subsp. sativa]
MIVFVIPIKFALLFKIGNVLTIGSTAFLMGPEQQINMMLDLVHIYATFIYAGCVLLALICALLIRCYGLRDWLWSSRLGQIP